MIPVTKLVYEFKQRLHHRNTSYSQAIEILDVCGYLNQAQNRYFENRVEQQEKSKLVEDDLRAFEMNEVSLTKEEIGNRVLFKYEDDHYQTLRQKVVVSKDTCGEKILPIRIFSSDNYDQNIDNTMWKSSYEWEDIMAIKYSKGFQFRNPDDFDIKEVVVDYYRRPREVHAPSLSARDEYITSSGENISEDRDCEFDTTLAYEKIVDLAVLFALRDIGDVKDWQTQTSKILNTEKIYK